MNEKKSHKLDAAFGARPILVRNAIVAFLALGMFLSLGASWADAERKERSRDPKRTRTLVVLRIADALDLNEEQTLRLGSEYRRFDKRRHELVADRLKTEEKLEQALERKPLDNADLEQLTNRLLTIDKELILMPDALFDSVQDMLSTEQKARLALLKIKLQRRIDRERNRRNAKGKGKPAAGAAPPSGS